MGDIPEDVMKAAARAYDDAQKHEHHDLTRNETEAAISRAILADRARRVKVRPLVWVNEDFGVGDVVHTAYDAGLRLGYEIRESSRNYLIRVRLPGQPFQKFDGVLNEAEDFCQADYEHRVLAPLEFTDEPVHLEDGPDTLTVAYMAGEAKGKERADEMHEMGRQMDKARIVELETELASVIDGTAHEADLVKMEELRAEMRERATFAGGKITALEARLAEAKAQAEKYKGLAEDGAECLLEWANLVKAKTSEIEVLAGENRRLRETPERPWTSEELSALQDLLAKTAGRLAAAEADAERLAEALRLAVDQIVGWGGDGFASGADAALAAHEARKERS